MRNISSAVLIAAAYGCGDQSQVTQPRQQRSETAAVSYTVTKLPSLGGTQSRGMAINGQGWVAGWSNQPDGTRRAVIWKNGVISDNLQTLGGPSSTVPWPGLNDFGTVVGVSHTSESDPLDEDWACELGGFLPGSTDLICRGFVWENGSLRDLPPLGGHHSFGAGVNNRGLVVGWAETATVDRTCSEEAAQELQFLAVLWDPKDRSDGKIKARPLQPSSGHSTSAATAINDKGQVVGISGDCDQGVGRFSARHAVMWDNNGKPTRLPDLGGISWHTPMDINVDGDVVGFSNPDEEGDAEGEFISRAFYLPHGGTIAHDLGMLPGDSVSEAFAINARDEVVGISFGDPVVGPRAFIWRNGVLTDLNDLVDIKPDTLLSAQDINDAGQITGRVREAATGRVLAFIANPIAE